MRNAKLYNLLKEGYRPTALKWQQRTGSMSLVKRIFEVREDQAAGKLAGRILTVLKPTFGGATVAEYQYVGTY